MELAGGGDPGVLTLHVEQSGGDLPGVGPHRVPVLLHEADAVVVVERHDRDRAGVTHELAGHLPRGTEVDRLAHDVPDHAVVGHLRLHDGSGVETVGQGLHVSR